MLSHQPSPAVDSSPIRERVRLPLLIRVLPHLKDHCFEGKTILPAVDILQQLAGSLMTHRPDADIRCMQSASFGHFLLTKQDTDYIDDLYHELEFRDSGRISSRLISEAKIRGTGITRTKVHAAVDFATKGRHPASIPMDIAAALEGVCYKSTSQALYDDLVPFGPAYHNVRGDVYLSESGGIAQVYAAMHPAPSEPLGSPFPLDGAFHVACAWGQRYLHCVVFPVGFEERFIVLPTVPGELYSCRILPTSITGKIVKFDIWIHDRAGCLREYVRNLIMKDVSGGRVQPPHWIRSERGASLKLISGHCQAFSLIEVDAVADFAEQALSTAERERFKSLGRKRQAGFLAGRLALKHLARNLAGGDRTTPASEIDTLQQDHIHPCCPVPDSRNETFCSLSHDSRFAIAVAGDREIGVDVEMISDRVMKVRHLFMGDNELSLTEASPLGVREASLRVWSIKEGIVKATGKTLEESWRHASIEEIGWHKSRLNVEGVKYAAIHDTEEGHVFTVIYRE